MTTNLFDKLGIDKTAGITDDEIKAIQNMLEKIKVRAAQVAEVNDADDTKRILGAYYTFLGLFVGKSANEIEAAFVAIQAALGGSAAPRALGTSGAPTTGDPDSLADQLHGAEAENGVLKVNQNTLKRAVEVVLGSSIPVVDGAIPASTVRDVQARIAQIKTEAAAAVGSADYVRKDSVKAKLDAVKAAINAQTTSVTRGSTIEGKDTALQAVDAALVLVS